MNSWNLLMPPYFFISKKCSIIGGILLCGGLYSMLWGKSRETKTVQCNIEATTVDDSAQDEVHRELEEQKENKGREEQEKVELETCIQQV
jgi:hypothetical protein